MAELTYKSLEEAAADTNIPKSILYKLVNREDFPALKVGQRWVIPKALLAEWIEEQARKRAKL